MSEFDFRGATPASDSLDDEEEPKRKKGVTVLDRLRAELEDEVRLPEIQLKVPQRPNISLRFDPNILDADLIKKLRRKSGEGSKKGFDGFTFGLWVLAHTNNAIFVDDEQVTNEDGVGVTFASREIQEITDTETPLESIRSIFAVDIHIEATALKILDAAGYADDVEEADPTKESSIG